VAVNTGLRRIRVLVHGNRQQNRHYHRNFLIQKEKCDNIVRYMKKYMLEALEEAKKAYDLGEVPIGAIVEKDGEIIGRGHNLTETAKDPTAHAEMIALRQAAAKLGGWRLLGCNLYVTAEPCAMCAGAIVWSRIEKLYIGTMDPKGGACGSVFNIPQEPKLNHYVEIETGILQEECQQILKTFFKELRKKKSEERKS
jgi:tRNA(adenine34) deaminase